MKRHGISFCLLHSALLLLFFASLATAAPTITLPLQGYYRPGKFFPIQIQSDAPQPVRIDIPGGVGALGSSVLKDFAVIINDTTTHTLRVQVGDETINVAVRPLAIDETLLLVSKDKFPSPPTVNRWPGGPIVVATIEALPDRSPQAYQTADWIAWPAAELPSGWPNDSLPAGSQGLTQLDQLWTMGAAILPITPGQPIAPSPAILRKAMRRGPQTSLAAAPALELAGGFHAARSPELRRTVWLLMALLSIATVAAALLVKRRKVLAVVGLTIVVGGVYATVYAGESPISSMVAAVDAEVPGAYQRDIWMIRSSLSPADDVWVTGVNSLTIPVLPPSGASMWLEPSNDGWLFHTTVKRGVKFAFIWRDIWMSRSDMQEPESGQRYAVDLARRLYLRPGDRLVEAPNTAPLVVMPP